MSHISVNEKTADAWRARRAAEIAQDQAEFAASLDSSLDTMHAFIATYRREIAAGVAIGTAAVIVASMLGIV